MHIRRQSLVHYHWGVDRYAHNEDKFRKSIGATSEQIARVRELLAGHRKRDFHDILSDVNTVNGHIDGIYFTRLHRTYGRNDDAVILEAVWHGHDVAINPNKGVSVIGSWYLEYNPRWDDRNWFEPNGFPHVGENKVWLKRYRDIVDLVPHDGKSWAAQAPHWDVVPTHQLVDTGSCWVSTGLNYIAAWRGNQHAEEATRLDSMWQVIWQEALTDFDIWQNAKELGLTNSPYVYYQYGQTPALVAYRERLKG